MNRPKLKSWLFSLALISLSAPAAAFDIFQLPMFSTGSVQPNVMLLVDTSGSMNNIIWADAYDPSVTYTDWSDGGTLWSASSSNIHFHNLTTSGCSASRKKGKNSSGTTKCLRLPDPEGNAETRYTGNYLNYLFSTYAHNDDLRNGVIPDDYRMNVARTVAIDIVQSITGIRFGTSHFYNPSSYSSAHGATIDQGCAAPTATHLSNIVSDINGYDAEANTPLAESLYEITRYFRGLQSYYHSGLNYTSPLEYRCQQNFVIAITDGLPTYDDTYSSSDPDDPSGSPSLPDWDGLSPATTQAMHPFFPQYSDGFNPSGSSGSEGYSLYLDDIAKFGFDVDIKTSGSDAEGGSWQDVDFPIQNINTYTIGFSIANQMLADAAEYGGGQFFFANNAADLRAALTSALLAIQASATSATSVELNSTRFDNNTVIYQAKYDSDDWSGNVFAFPVNADGSLGSEDWNAQAQLPAHGARNIWTMNSSSRNGTTFNWANLSTAQQTALGASAVADPWFCPYFPCSWNIVAANCSKCGGATSGQDELAHLRGDQSNEQQNGGTLRDRTQLIGDIVDSDPRFVGKADFGFNLLPGAEGSTYGTFRQSVAYQNRDDMLYVGANDGMLHGFNAATGVEEFSYIPMTVYPNLKALTLPNYTHQFFVDGPTAYSDVYIDTGSGDAWHTVIVGSLGAGGKGVYAIDVTDPANPAPLWEYVHMDDADIGIVDDVDLGYTYAQPRVVRMANGKWVALVSNGLNSDNHHAALLAIDMETGALIRKIDTGVGSAGTPNGLSNAFAVDLDSDRVVDYVYAGDMLGNLWKFDVTDPVASNWDVAYKPSGVNTPLFTALDPSSAPQAITSQPQVTLHPEGGLMVLFGTGQFFEETDRSANTSPQVQTFYGIRDQGVPVTGGRSDLIEQVVLQEVNAFGFDLRVTTDNPVPVNKSGWFFDLPDTGERQVSRPIIRNGRIIFSTVIPNTNICSGGGESWLMEMDAFSGSRLVNTPWDLDGDGLFNSNDYVTITLADGSEITVPVSGKKSNVGVIKTPGIISAGDVEYKFAGGSTGGIELTVEEGNVGAGRQSWRQIQ